MCGLGTHSALTRRILSSTLSLMNRTVLWLMRRGLNPSSLAWHKRLKSDDVADYFASVLSRLPQGRNGLLLSFFGQGSVSRKPETVGQQQHQPTQISSTVDSQQTKTKSAGLYINCLGLRLFLDVEVCAVGLCTHFQPWFPDVGRMHVGLWSNCQC